MKQSNKIHVLFFSIVFFSIASAQSQSGSTPKLKDSIKNVKSIDLGREKKVDSDTVRIVKSAEQKTEENSSALGYSGKLVLYKMNAHASYYAEKFHGRRTASGKPFDMYKFTAAHKKLPFGTKVKVTNEANGKSVIVEINDRGPFVKSREIDLSKKAFFEIAGKSSAGMLRVTMEIVSKK